MKDDFTLGFLGVGPQRTGTSWLHTHFRKHPDIVLPHPPRKEVHFFDDEYRQGWSWYAGQFPSSFRDQSLTGEFGPSYFDIPAIPRRVHRHAPDCKIIVSLRDPIERTRSLFHHHFKKGRVPDDFTEAIRRCPRILSSSHYRTHLKRWLEFFGDDQVHLVFLQDIKRQPAQTLSSIFEFLGLTSLGSRHIERDPVNSKFLPRWPIVQRLKVCFGRFLAKYRLHTVLRGLKAIYRAILKNHLEKRKSPDQFPELSKREERALRELYADDVEWLRRHTGRDLQSW